jgi:hypothetical protein
MTNDKWGWMGEGDKETRGEGDKGGMEGRKGSEGAGEKQTTYSGNFILMDF